MHVLAGIILALMAMVVLPAGMLSFVASWAVAIHEVCHGLAAMMTGGSIASLDVQWEHGLALTRGGWYPIVSMAGYVGTAMVGALFFLASVHAWARWASMVFLLGAGILLCMHAHLSGAFVFALIINVAVIVCLFLDHRGACASFFATLLLYPQWGDIRQLLWYAPASTDAGLLAQHLGAAWLAWPIALMYTAGTVLVWYAALRHLLRLRKSRAARSSNTELHPTSIPVSSKKP